MSEDDEKKEQEKGGEKKSEDSQEELENILGSLKESDKAAKEEKKVPPKQEQPEVPKLEVPESAGEESEGIEEILDSITEKPELEPVADMNILQRIFGIFTGPAQVFKYLRAKPDFLIPLLLAILIGIGSGFLFYDIAINDQITNIEENDRIPDDQKGQILDRMEGSKTGSMRLLSPLVFGPLGILVIYVLITLVFWFIGNVLLGGKAKFKQVFSVLSYSYLIIIILESIVKVPLILSKQTLKIDMSPGVLIETAGMSETLSRFIGSFDIFHIWFLIVFGIGFSIIYGFSKLKGLVSVFIAWLLYVVVFKIALASLTQGFLG
jgi:hypothetical protein